MTSPKHIRTYGCEKIPTYLYKISSIFISPYLNYICNKTLSSGNFPKRLK